MAAKSEFQQILNGFLEGKRASSTFSPSENQSAGGIDPAHLAFLMGTVRVGTGRPRSVRPQEQQAPRPSRPQGNPHFLDNAQQESKAWFEENGETLEADFTADELKKSFRRLALRFHPDRPGGSATRFRTLMGHEKALRKATEATTQSAA